MSGTVILRRTLPTTGPVRIVLDHADHQFVVLRRDAQGGWEPLARAATYAEAEQALAGLAPPAPLTWLPIVECRLRDRLSAQPGWGCASLLVERRYLAREGEHWRTVGWAVPLAARRAQARTDYRAVPTDLAPPLVTHETGGTVVVLAYTEALYHELRLLTDGLADLAQVLFQVLAQVDGPLCPQETLRVLGQRVFQVLQAQRGAERP